MVSQRDPRIGTTVLEKLRVDARLGAGGMGAVYKVHHLVTKHDRALKVLHPELAEDEAVIKRLMREAGVAGTLRSPHVVETLDVGWLADGSPYVLMELLEGETLADRMERGDLRPEQLIGFVCQACEGIVHAHGAGIVHRDLKPDNLFIVRTPEGEERIKILDFGISKFQVEKLDDGGAVTREGTILGTPLYMSPEQAMGQASLGPPTDLYSLGVILYEGLSGQTPHPASTFPQLIIRLATTPAVPLREVVPGIHPKLAAIVDEALAMVPADRPASAAALLEALAPFAEERQVAHLETLRGVAIAHQPALISMADTMAGGLISDAPSMTAEPRTGVLRGAAEPAKTPGKIEPAAAEPASILVERSTGEVIPRPRWVPWAVAAVAAALVGIAAIALMQTPDEVGADATVPAIADEENQEPSLPVGLDPEPGTVAEPALEPLDERDEPAAAPPPPHEPAPAIEPAPAERGSRRRGAPADPQRFEVARDNPYE
jgi:serine/threonine-protein kinase